MLQRHCHQPSWPRKSCMGRPRKCRAPLPVLHDVALGFSLALGAFLQQALIFPVAQRHCPRGRNPHGPGDPARRAWKNDCHNQLHLQMYGHQLPLVPAAVMCQQHSFQRDPLPEPISQDPTSVQLFRHACQEAVGQDAVRLLPWWIGSPICLGQYQRKLPLLRCPPPHHRPVRQPLAAVLAPLSCPVALARLHLVESHLHVAAGWILAQAMIAQVRHSSPTLTSVETCCMWTPLLRH
mmetsp:Transcript_64853/g.125125  ORF Transcript_64853/g.125125 Transcript_64853/m.125125 type:complete len:237 (+) Transcript_64853:324-1034(+)